LDRPFGGKGVREKGCQGRKGVRGRKGGGERVSGTCEKMYFEERGVGTMVGEYVTIVGW